MESPIAVLLLVIATVVIGLVLLTLSSAYSAYQSSKVYVQEQAENIANGLYITVSKPVNTSSGSSVYIIVPYDFNYNGTIYITAFYVPSYMKGFQQVTPQFAYIENNEIVYAEINSTKPTINATTLYFTNLNLMYQGKVELWETVTGAPQVITVSPPKGYITVVLIFAQVDNKFMEVGYEWL